jgi:hypothetical protein
MAQQIFSIFKHKPWKNEATPYEIKFVNQISCREFGCKTLNTMPS